MPRSPACKLHLAACDCLTPLGQSQATLQALLEGRSALNAVPVLGRDGGDAVPLALLPGRDLDEAVEPAWLAPLKALTAPVQGPRFGGPRTPIFITSSNFGVGALYAFRRTGNPQYLDWGAVTVCVDWLRAHLGWGPNVTIFSHACVSSHIGLLQASQWLEAGLAEKALVFSFDFLSPFVSGGFHALKILNSDFPAPYQERENGAIGLGDGAAWALLTRDQGDFRLQAQALHNEMFHFTANQPDGTGFKALLGQLAPFLKDRRLWLKGHGTGTLEAGRLEAGCLAEALPAAPLVGWKGALGHTLGSCGLVELAIACEAIRAGKTPGTIGTTGPTFSPTVATSTFSNGHFDGLLSLSNAFGGAHAALLLEHA